MNTKRETMYQRIEKHGADLNRIFNTPYGNIEICKKLRRLEVKAHRLATDYCNGENGVNTDNWDALCEPILKAVKRILGQTTPVILNGDARGYALKLPTSWVADEPFYKDWGGYGILAPDFNID